MTRLGSTWRMGCVVLAVSLAPAAQAASPVPAFPEEGTVTIQGVPDRFDKLRAFLREHRSPVGAKYHVAVVAFTDPLNREGPAFGDESGAYLDSVVEAWRQRVDTEDAVILLLGLRNREVRVHPFSRWVQLGWEAYAVVKTVKAARFDSFARAGDYDTGMKELVLAIDAELARRSKAVEERAAQRLKAEADALQRNKDRIAQAYSGIVSFVDRMKQAPYVPPGAHEAHARAVATVASAQSALGEADASKAFTLAERAISDTAQAMRLLTEFETLEAATRARWQELQTRAAALEGTLVEAPFEVSRERALLEQATLALQEAEKLLAAHAPTEAASRLTNAEATLRGVEEGLVQARQSQELKGVLARIAAGVIALALLAWLISLHRRSARCRREAQELLQQWETLLGRVATHLMKFEEEHTLFLGRAGPGEPFEGATAGPVREAAREVDNLFLTYAAAQQVLIAAKEDLAHARWLPWLRERPYTRAIERLTVDEAVARSEDLTRRKPLLPGSHEVRMTPGQLVAELQSAQVRTGHLVEELETRFRAAWKEQERLEGELGAMKSLLLEGRLVELTEPSVLRDEKGELERQLLALRERARKDPLGVAEDSKRIEQPLSKLLARAGRLEQAASLLQGEVPRRRKEASAALEGLHAEGLTVDEPGFGSDTWLGTIDRLSEEALRAVRAGRDEEAAAKSQEAAARASELLQLCERVRRSREELAGHLSQAEVRVRTLRERLPERRERLRDLRKSHADAALQPALDNAEEATDILAQAARSLSEARACTAPGVRHYLAGVELFDRAVQQLDAVDALYREIETKAGDLALAREATEQALTAVSRDLADTVGEAMADGVPMNAELDEAHLQARKTLSELRQAMAEQRPDWLALRQRATALASEAAAALKYVRAGVAAKPRALMLLKELPTWRGHYARILERSPQAHRATLALFMTVSQELDDAVAMSRGPKPSWPQVLESLERAAEGFIAVSRRAQEDFPLAQGARTALAAANLLAASLGRS